MDAESSTGSASERRRVPGRPFKPGRSGNPGGRPKELLNAQKLARSYTTEAVEALVRGLKDPKHYVAAAIALLDRGWGRPTQPIAGDEARPHVIRFEWADATPPAPTIEAEPEDADTAAGGMVVHWQGE
jgi:hypothetical protein